MVRVLCGSIRSSMVANGKDHTKYRRDDTPHRVEPHIHGDWGTMTRSQLRTVLFGYIESFYNRQRHHARIGQRTPAETYSTPALEGLLWLAPAPTIQP